MGSILFLFALVAGYFYFVALGAQAGPSVQSGNPLPYIATKLPMDLYQAQQSLNLFLRASSPESVSAHRNAVSNLLSHSQELAQTARKIGSKKSVAAANSVSSSVKEYDAVSTQLVELRQTRGEYAASGLLQELAQNGRQLEEMIARNEAGSLALSFLQIQSHAKDYLRNGSPGVLENLQATIRNFYQQLRATQIEPVEAQVLRKGIREYNAALDRYLAVSLAAEDRSLSNALTKEKQRQAEEMQAAANTIQAALNRINVPDATLFFQKTRRLTADYILTGDKKYADSVQDNLNVLTNLFNDSAILKEHKQQVQESIARYRQVFISLVEQDALIREQLERLRTVAQTLASQLNELTGTLSGTSTVSTAAGAVSGSQSALIGAVAALAVILIGLLTGVLLGRSISGPLSSMTRIIRRINSEKDFSVEIPVNSRTEIGQLAGELNTLLHLNETTFLESSEKNLIQAGELKNLQQLIHDLEPQLGKICETGDNVAGIAESQKKSIEGISASIKALIEYCEALAQASSEPEEQKQLPEDAAGDIGRSLESALAEIKNIADVTPQIGGIIKQSSEIAEQTNLLALNASVKAARAGSKGKEFSLIADEIAKLSQRSEDVAREAGRLTADLDARLAQAVQLADEAEKLVEQANAGSSQHQMASGELARHAADIKGKCMDLENNAGECADFIRELDFMTKKQSGECTVAQDMIAVLEEKSQQLTANKDDSEQEGFDETLRKAVDNIAVSLDEPDDEKRSVEEETVWTEADEEPTSEEIDKKDVAGEISSQEEPDADLIDEGKEEK